MKGVAVIDRLNRDAQIVLGERLLQPVDEVIDVVERPLRLVDIWIKRLGDEPFVHDFIAVENQVGEQFLRLLCRPFDEVAVLRLDREVVETLNRTRPVMLGRHYLLVSFLDARNEVVNHLFGNRFEQIVRRLQVERIDRVLAVRRREDDLSRLGQTFGEIETVHLGHLDIEKDEVDFLVC